MKAVKGGGKRLRQEAHEHGVYMCIWMQYNKGCAIQKMCVCVGGGGR